MARVSSFAIQRDLSVAVPRALPLSIVRLSALSVPSIDQWFADHGVEVRCHLEDNLVRGYLVAARGHGIVFVESSTDLSEARFTLAHEVAHFVLHHFLPRIRALERLGNSIVDALDGHRPFTPEERLGATISDTSLARFEHSYVRSSDGQLDSEETRLEIEADLLAFELLAPRGAVNALVFTTADTAAALEQHFGLPEWAAAAYADLLARPQTHAGAKRWLD